MFTLEQINNAHAKVKSGADFPAYIHEIKLLGVTHYEANVADGSTYYHGKNGFTVRVPAKYSPLTLSDNLNIDEFKLGLVAHQLGRTDYPTFLQMCAETGIEKWKININLLSCTYFDISGNEVLTEEIPG